MNRKITKEKEAMLISSLGTETWGRSLSCANLILPRKYIPSIKERTVHTASIAPWSDLIGWIQWLQEFHTEGQYNKPKHHLYSVEPTTRLSEFLSGVMGRVQIW